MESSAPTDPRDEISLVGNDLAIRLQQRVGLVPRRGLGVARRTLFWTALAWLPIVIWAWAAGRALPAQGQPAEPLLQHFGVHARLLLGIPLLIFAEAVAHAVLSRLTPQFVRAGIIRPAQLPRFRAILADTVRLRDSSLPWVVIIGLAFAWAFAGTVLQRAHELSWAVEGSQWSLGFGGWWYVYVGRPIFLALLLAWLWRVLLLTIALARIAKLDLVIVPTHPDRAGGLGFLDRIPSAFSLVAFAPAIVIAAGWAHDAEYHGLDVHTLYPMMIAGLVLMLAIFLAPVLSFVPSLGRAKKQALLDYGALVARHGAAVRTKWILVKPETDDPLLEAPEIGPVADTVALYEAVTRMRPVPIGKSSLLAIAAPVLIAFVAVLAIQIPLGDMLGRLAKGLL